MKYLQYTPTVQITTPLHRGKFPNGINAQINLYDPLTGKVEAVHNTSNFQMQQMSQNPSGYNVNIVGSPNDVERINNLLKNSQNLNTSNDTNNNIDNNSDDQYIDINEENIKLMAEKNKKEQMNKKSQNINFEKPVSIFGNLNEVARVKNIIYENKSQENKQNNDKQIEQEEQLYEITEENIRMLSEKNKNEMKQNGNGQNYGQNYTDLYPNSSWHNHGDLIVHPSISTLYTGSGALLFEKDYIHNNQKIYSVILYKEPDDKFGDIGGNIEIFQPGNIDNTLGINAKNTIYQNTYGFISITSDITKNPYVDIKNNDLKVYRCFLIGVDGKLLDIKNTNLKEKLNNNKSIYSKLHPYLEATKMRDKLISRFNLETLFKSIKNAETNGHQFVETTDIDGNKCILTNRIVNILKNIQNISTLTGIYNDLIYTNYIETTDNFSKIIL